LQYVIHFFYSFSLQFVSFVHRNLQMIQLCARFTDVPVCYKIIKQVSHKLGKLELSGNFVNLEKSWNLRYDQGNFFDNNRFGL